MQRNYKGEDMTAILDMYNDAARKLLAATEEGRYFGEEKSYYNLCQNVFYIAMYQTVLKAWEYYERYLPNTAR